jgi:type II secretory pathway pseudopilin PulG
MTLIEVVVACTLLSITLTALTSVAIRMGARARTNAILEQRTVVFAQEIDRLASIPYDSIGAANSSFLKSDSVRSGNGYYVWSYVIGAAVPGSTTGVAPYRDITLTVTPRLAPTATQKMTIRRARAPYTNPINTGA